MKISKEIRATRAAKRDRYIGEPNEIIKKYERRYFPAEEYDLKEYDPFATADVVIH